MPRRLLILFLLTLVQSPLFSQGTTSRTTTPDLESLTRLRLRAAEANLQQDWQKDVAANVVIVDASGTREDRDHFWQQELELCNGAHCAVDTFSVKLQPGIGVVNYSLIVDSSGHQKLIHATDTYVEAGSVWKVLSGFRTTVPNARKMRVVVEVTTLQSYTGQYSDQEGKTYDVYLENGKLFVRPSGETSATELIPESSTKFYVIGDEVSRTEFKQSRNNEVTGIVVHTNTGDRTFTKAR